MAKQIEFHDFTNSKGATIRVSLLNNDGIRVTYRKTSAHVTWHATSPNAIEGQTTTIITPA